MYERLGIDVKVGRGFNFCVSAQPFIHCLYFIYTSKNNARVEIYPHTKHCIKANDTRKGNLFISWNSLRDSLREEIKNEREINHFLPTSKLFCSKCSVNGRNTNASMYIAATNDARNKVVQNILVIIF